MLKIYGRITSVNVMKVLWACVEMNIPYTREDVGGEFGKTKEAWYLAMNPNARVPTIDDDGFTLWESNTIVRYLAAKHGKGTLWPEDPKVRADGERWMDWQLAVLGPALAPGFWQLIRTPTDKRDMKLVEQSRQASIEALKMLDACLADRDFVAGKTLTCGDLPAAAVLHRWFKLPYERPKMANLERYYARLAERPGYKQHVMLPLS
jgi:glutathione S-transferase